MDLISVKLHMIRHLQTILERLNLLRVLILRSQHADRNSNKGRILPIHQRRMHLRGSFERRVFGRA
jgi:hypothetical protein